MQFNSYIFILVYIPIVLMLYFMANKISIIGGKLVILIASLVFYAYSGVYNTCVLLLSIIINYIFVKIIESNRQNKLCLFVPIMVNVALLFYFKYLGFTIDSINALFGTECIVKKVVLPLGISFFTFQQIAYIVAIEREEINKVELLDYFIYILYFPKLLMGPLMDPVGFNRQINDSSLKKINVDNIAYGLKVFSYGLFKKVFLADIFAKVANLGGGSTKTR